MAGEFDRFLNEMLNGGGTRNSVMPSPSPLPPSAGQFLPPGATGGGLPHQLVQQIAQAAQMAGRSVAPSMPPVQMPVSQTPPWSPDMLAPSPQAMAQASAAPVYIPEGRRNAGGQRPHGQAVGDEGYVIVNYADEAGAQHVIFVPESYAENLPQNAQVISDGVVTHPQQIANARKNGALLEQQPESIGIAFRSTKPSDVSMKEAQQGADMTGAPMHDPTVIGEKTIQQQTDIYNQTQPNVWTADEIEQVDPEHAAMMRANGIESYDLNNEILVEQDGKVVVIKRSEQYGAADSGELQQGTHYGNIEPEGTALPRLTRASIREMGYDTVANEMERDGIAAIPDGQMLVRDQSGTVSLAPADDVAPDGMEIVLYGGESAERHDAGLMPDMSITEPKSWLQLLTPLGVASDAFGLDKLRQWMTGKVSEYMMTRDSDDAPLWVKVMKYTQGGRFFEGAVDVAGLILPEKLEENTMLPGFDFAMWYENNQEIAQEAYENGYVDPETGQEFTGYRAVWERYSADQPLGQRVISDLGIDPLNWFYPTGGSLRRGATQIAGDAATTSPVRRGAATVMDTTGRVLQAPDALVDRFVEPALRGAMQGVQRIPGVGRALQPSERTVLDTMDQTNLETGSGILQRPARSAPGPEPAQVGPGQPGARMGDTGVGVTTRQGADFVAGTTPDGTPFVGRHPNPPADTPVTHPGMSDVTPQLVDEPTASVSDPFKGLEIGRKPDWEFSGAEDIEIIDQYTTRIIDDRWNKSGRNGDPEWNIFAADHDPKVRWFVEQEKQSKRFSMGWKAARGGMDYPQKAASAINEARYVVEDLIPDTVKTWGNDVAIPEYRFHREMVLRDGTVTDKWPGMDVAKDIDWRKQRDDFLIERMIFDQSEASQLAAEQLVFRAGRDETIAHFLPYARRYKAAFRQQLNKNFTVNPAPTHPWVGSRFEQFIGSAPPPRDFAAEAATGTGSGWRQAQPSTDPLAQPGTGPRQEWIDWTSRGSDEPGSGQGFTTDPRARVQPDSIERVPVEDIRSTYSASKRELEKAGLSWVRTPESRTLLQFRDEPYSPGSLERMKAAGWSDDAYDPIGVVRGRDGKLWVYSGHTRLQFAKESGQKNLLVKVTSETDPDALVEMARRSNTSQSGYSHSVLARQVRELSDQGMSLDDIGRTTGFANDARADTAPGALTGRARAEKYEAMSHIPESSQVWRHIDTGTVDVDTAAIIGRGYKSGVLEVNDATNIVNNVLSGKWTQRDVAASVRRRIRNRTRPGQESLGLFEDAGIEVQSGGLTDTEVIGAAAEEISGAADSTAFSSVIPGGPQLSRVVSDLASDTGPLRRPVDNPFHTPRTESEFVSADTATHQRFMGRDLAAPEREFVNTPFSDGDTIGARWQKHADDLEGSVPDGATDPLNRLEAEEMGLARVLDEYAADYLKANYAERGPIRRGKKSRAEIYDEAVTRISAKKDIDPATIHTQAWAEALHGDSAKLLDGYDTTLKVLREMALYNGLTGTRYFTTQVVGNSITAFLAGHTGTIRRAFNARNYRGAYFEASGNADDWVMRGLSKAINDPLPANGVADAIDSISGMPAHMLHDDADEIISRLGLGKKRHDVSRVVRDQVTENVSGEMRMKQVGDDLRLGRFKLPKVGKWTAPLANRHVRDLSNASDIVMRKSLYADMLSANVADARPAFRQMMEDGLPAGADNARFNQLFDELPPVFGSDDIRNTFGEISEGYAERMARDWQNSIYKMDRHARDEVRRVFFSGEMTNLDEALQRVVFFHYWMSRASVLYTTSLMRNPGYLNAFIKMMHEIEQQELSGKYGSAVNGFLKIMGTYQGFNIFIRPDAMLQTVFALGNESDFDPENETGLGAWIRKNPLFVNPLIASGINLLGYSGNTFAPDPLLLGNWSNFVTNGLNLVDAYTGGAGEPNENKYQAFWGWLRTITSGHTPGSHDIPNSDSTVYAQRDIAFLIQDVAEENGFDPVGPEAVAAREDPTHPWYQEAFKRYANGQAMQQAFRILPSSVLYPKVRVARGDEVRYNINNTEFGTDENQHWRDQRTYAQKTDPKARKLWDLGNQYYEIGTPESREAYGIYNGIRYGGLSEYVVIDGVFTGEKQLLGLSEEERKSAADRWAEQNGHIEEINLLREERGAFNDANPEWKAYQEWAGSVRNFDNGGADGWWATTIEGNPNAARWYEDNIPGTMPERERQMRLSSPDAYMATMGIQQDMYQPSPISTNNQQVQPYLASSPSSGGYGNRSSSSGAATTPQSLREDAMKYQQDMDAFSAQAGVNIDGLNPMARNAYLSNLRGQGISPPSMPNRLRLYYQWRDQQPPGSDSSEEAYVRWLEGGGGQ